MSLDSPETGIELLAVAKRVPQDFIIIGNISPIGALLNGHPGDVENEVIQLLKRMDPYPNFVLSSGCDLPQETPVENIHAFFRTGRSYKVKKTVQELNYLLGNKYLATPLHYSPNI